MTLDSLAGSGTIPVVSAAILAVGADFGSAIAVQVLTLPVQVGGPIAIFVGGSFYLNSNKPQMRNFGRVVLGLGLIFLSLALIRQAVAPLQGFDGTKAILAYLNKDPVTAALLGLCLTFAMHSSVAAILTALAFASHGELGLIAGLGYVIGCNIGSAVLPVWLLRGDEGAATVVAKSVAVLRVLLAIFVLTCLSLTQFSPTLPQNVRVDQALLWAHLGFNAALLLLAPALTPLVQLFPTSNNADRPHRAILPDGESDPQIIIAGLTTHVTQMLDLLSQMLDRATGNAADLGQLTALEAQMNNALSELRETYAALPETLGTEDAARIRQIVDFAIRVEASGDLLSGKFATIRTEGLRGDFVFSDAGLAEINDMTAEVRKGILLAQQAFWSGDVTSARRLLAHKQQVTQREADSKANHLRRIQSGNLLRNV